MFWSGDKRPDPDAFIDRTGYYRTLRVCQIDLYQSYFNKILEAIRKHDYIGSHLSQADLKKAKDIAEQAAKDDKLVVDYLLVYSLFTPMNLTEAKGKGGLGLSQDLIDYLQTINTRSILKLNLPRPGLMEH